MAIHGSTDAAASQPKWIKTADGTPAGVYAGTGAFLDTSLFPAGTSIVFVDATEVTIPANVARGLSSPGWWKVTEKTDSDGNTRYTSEHLAWLEKTAVAAGDQTDDTIVADAINAITISVQPANQTTVVGAATFNVTAAVTNGGTLIYQWQTATATGTKFTNVAGANAASLVLSGLATGDTGKKYRVKITSSNGAPEVVSSVATVTFGS